MNKEQWSYVAGFLDGEGHILVQIKKAKSAWGKFCYVVVPYIYLTQKDTHVLFKIKEFLESEGITSGVYCKDKKNNTHRLMISNWKNVIPFVNNTLPYSIVKKYDLLKVLDMRRMKDKHTANDIKKILGTVDYGNTIRNIK